MIKKCEYCGKTFETNNKYKRYCDRDCKHRHKNQRVKKGIRRDGIEYTKVCPICGKQFVTKVINKEYCSEKCYNTSRKEYCKAYYQKHVEYYKNYYKKYMVSNHETYLKIRRRYTQKRYKTDVSFRLKSITSTNIRRCITNRSDKTQPSLKYVDYTIPELKQHIESLFVEGMSWDNHGSIWHVDHIKPLASYNFYNQDGTLNLDAIREANSLSNLQPMFIKDNLSKSSWYEGKLYYKGMVVSER